MVSVQSAPVKHSCCGPSSLLLANFRGGANFILLDFSKAFDKVPYWRLLNKLTSMDSEAPHFIGLNNSFPTEKRGSNYVRSPRRLAKY